MNKLTKKIAAWSSETKVGVVIGLIAVVFFTTLAITTGGQVPIDSSSSTSSSVSSSSLTTSSPTTSIPVNNPLNEIMGKPFIGNVQTVRYYFDANTPLEQLEDAIVFYNNKYEPSKGMDFALNNTEFTVIASLSGVVTSKVSDPIYGLTVTIASANDVEIIYSSLASADVQVGQEISKGATIGKAGEAVFGSDLQTKHLNLQVKINSKLVNPQLYFGVAVKDMNE
jgi:murein DD-endopeptidase MepM/ murein hydrolase activator NlpD